MDSRKVHRNRGGSRRTRPQALGGGGGKESAAFTVRLLAGFHLVAEKVTGVKEVRAQPLADQCEAGNVRIVRGEWNYRFIEELCVFPTGDYDDQVDAASGAFAGCVRNPPFAPPRPAPSPGGST